MNPHYNDIPDPIDFQRSNPVIPMPGSDPNVPVASMPAYEPTMPTGRRRWTKLANFVTLTLPIVTIFAVVNNLAQMDYTDGGEGAGVIASALVFFVGTIFLVEYIIASLFARKWTTQISTVRLLIVGIYLLASRWLLTFFLLFTQSTGIVFIIYSLLVVIGFAVTFFWRINDKHITLK